MWKLEIRWAGDNLSDRPEKGEYEPIVRKTSTRVCTDHWQKLWELEATAVSGSAIEVRRASNKEDWMKSVLREGLPDLLPKVLQPIPNLAKDWRVFWFFGFFPKE